MAKFNGCERLEKEDDYSLKITVDKVDIVTLEKLLENREHLTENKVKTQDQLTNGLLQAKIKLEEQLKNIEDALYNVDILIKKAQELGIKVKPKEEIKPESNK